MKWFGKQPTPSVEDLLKAVQAADLRAVQALLDAKVDVNATGSKGITALMLAAWLGQEGVVRALLDASADVEFPNGVLGSLRVKILNKMYLSSAKTVYDVPVDY